MELTVVVQVEDHGVPTLRDTAYLRVIVHSTTSSWHEGQRLQVGARSSPALRRGGRTAAAGVAVAVACSAVVLSVLAVLLVVVARRRTSDYKETEYCRSCQWCVETLVDNR